MLVALAEMAMWGQDLEDRSVVDTTIEEFPARMAELATRMHQIYREPIKDFLITL